MADATEFFLAVEKEAKKTRFEEKGKDAFHGQSLADYAAGGSGERGPVGAELKFHGDAGDDADGEIDAEDASPEPRGAIVVFVAGAKSFGFEINEQERQAHG